MDEEIEAIDVARRAAASDVGESTIGSLEQAADDMALAYLRTSPGVLLRRARAHLHYATGLLDNRMTLAEHSRLLVTTGWLSLLTATCLIDLRRFPAAAAHLRTAAQLARETGQPEIAGWCLETKAWQEIISGDYQRAAALAQAAQRVAPQRGSAYIQASGQEARAFARLGAAREARAALARTEALVAPLPQPDRPEHHYQYDPAKFEAYTATTLAWLGDPAAAGQGCWFRPTTGAPPRSSSSSKIAARRRPNCTRRTPSTAQPQQPRCQPSAADMPKAWPRLCEDAARLPGVRSGDLPDGMFRGHAGHVYRAGRRPQGPGSGTPVMLIVPMRAAP
jgi:tetratricopeptide (TPR) repeat protein